MSVTFNCFCLQDHVEEILRKWESIDDEIWAKVIVLERNRRVAKVSEGRKCQTSNDKFYSGLCAGPCPHG